jgi:hypothetical protein
MCSSNHFKDNPPNHVDIIFFGNDIIVTHFHGNIIEASADHGTDDWNRISADTTALATSDKAPRTSNSPGR